jgi:hypothetical protein
VKEVQETAEHSGLKREYEYEYEYEHSERGYCVLCVLYPYSRRMFYLVLSLDAKCNIFFDFMSPAHAYPPLPLDSIAVINQCTRIPSFGFSQ